MYKPQFRRALRPVAEAFAEVRMLGWSTPVLVDQAAVEFYTMGGVVTGDLAVTTPAREDFYDALLDRGFLGDGPEKGYGLRLVHPATDLVVEVVGLAPFDGRCDGARCQRVGVEDGGPHLCFVGVEDMIADRLGRYINGWPERRPDMLAEARALMTAEDVIGCDIDRDYLDRRIRAETKDVLDIGILQEG